MALFGATPVFAVGVLATFLGGACDAVGVTNRNQAVMLTTPDHLRGRARAGHSLAANVANSLGQIYVAAMCGTRLGPGGTMLLGGALTWLAVLVAAWRIPALLTVSDDDAAAAADAGGEAAADPKRDARARDPGGAEGLLDSALEL